MPIQFPESLVTALNIQYNLEQSSNEGSRLQGYSEISLCLCVCGSPVQGCINKYKHGIKFSKSDSNQIYKTVSLLLPGM